MSVRLPRVADLPPMEAPVTVVGDVHASPDEPEIAARFLRFLAAQEGRGGWLVLLGDIFDWWVGRRQAGTAGPARVLEALRRVAASGVRVAFQPGNRDYAFDGAPGLALTLWPDVVRTRWGARTVLLTHGDLLCSGDRAYLRMRRVLHSLPFRLGLAALPFAPAAYLAQGLRRLSGRTRPRGAMAGGGLDYGTARAWMEGLGADLLVTGHVHTGVHHRLAGPTPREVMVLKDWDRRGGVVRFDGQGVALGPA